MMLWPLLGIRPGVTAVIGSGGKTTLLRRLSEELPGTVLLCTSTHVFPFSGIPLMKAPTREALRAAFGGSRVICAGVPETETGKLTALPYGLSGLADFVLVEADGAHGLPLKAHAAWEPVIPKETDRTILVAGLSGLERPIQAVCHRPRQFAALCGGAEEDPVTPERLAAVLNAEGLADVIFLNQADAADGGPVMALLRTPCVLGSLQRREYKC